MMSSSINSSFIRATDRFDDYVDIPIVYTYLVMWLNIKVINWLFKFDYPNSNVHDIHKILPRQFEVQNLHCCRSNRNSDRLAVYALISSVSEFPNVLPVAFLTNFIIIYKFKNNKNKLLKYGNTVMLEMKT